MSQMNGGQQPQQQKEPMNQKEKLKDMAAKSKIFAAQLRSMPNFIAVFKAMANLRVLMCMLVALVMGSGIGLISSFLFWHLQVKKITKSELTKDECQAQSAQVATLQEFLSTGFDPAMGKSSSKRYHGIVFMQGQLYYSGQK